MKTSILHTFLKHKGRLTNQKLLFEALIRRLGWGLVISLRRLDFMSKITVF